MNLTEKEQNALLAITRHALNNMGGKEPSDLYDDNYSYFNRGDLSVYMSGGQKVNQHEAAGLMSSLDNKGLIVEVDHGDWALTDEGIRQSQEIWTPLELDHLEPR